MSGIVNFLLRNSSLSCLCIFLLFLGCKTVEPTVTDNGVPAAGTTPEVSEKLATDTVESIVYNQDITYHGSNERHHDLIHTKLEVSFDWTKQHLIGTATLELKPYFYEKDILILNARGFDIQSVYLLEGTSRKELVYEYDKELIVIDMVKNYQADEHFFIEIKYVAKPNELGKDGSDAITDNKGLYFINADSSDPTKRKQIWTQGQTQANSAWFPTIDSPNEKSTVELFITVENKFKTVSNGALIYSLVNEDETRTDYWKLDLPHAPYLTMMAVGEFAKVEDRWVRSEGDEIEVNYYVDSTYETHARAIFRHTPEMLSFFSKLLNYPFPWPKYDQIIVQDFVSGAMENTTASVFMEDLQISRRELLDYHWDDIIAHELVHHWFGNLVTCESWSNLPLNESFANYGEYLWFEHKYGVEEADYIAWEALETYLEESREKQENLIRYTFEDKEEMFDHHSYEKGGRVLHMLRNYVGDKAFFKALEIYLKRHAFQTAEIHDLRMAFEEVTGEDLNWFFNQWFLASGHPVIEVKHNQKGNLLTVEVYQQQELSTTPVFKLPVSLGIWLDENNFNEYPVEIYANYQKFEFEVNDSVRLVLFDPEKQLLGEVTHEKTPDEYIFQYYNGGALLARYEALENLAELAYEEADFYVILSEIFLSALNDPHWAIRELAADYFDEYEGELLVEVEKRLIDKAANDEKPQVRASALTSLSSIDSVKHKAVFKKSLNDQSYLVQGAALLAYSQSNAKDKSTIIDQYADTANSHIVFALAEHYSSNKAYNKNPWFIRQLQLADEEDQFYLIQYYGLFLSGAPEKVVNEGLPVLVKLARQGKKEYIRLAAFQSIGLLPDSESMATIKNEIKADEKSEELLRYYEEIGN